MESQKKKLDDTDDEHDKKKRLRLDDNASTFKYLLEAVQEIYKHKSADLFRAPVDVEGLKIPEYLNIIKHPMDIGTIRDNLVHKKYNDPDKVLEDVTLVWDNCFLFNEPNSYVSQCAQTLQKFFLKKLDQAPASMFTHEQIEKCRAPRINKYTEDTSQPPPKSTNRRATQTATPTHNATVTNAFVNDMKQRASANKTILRNAFPKTAPNLDDILLAFEGDGIPLTEDEKQRMFDIIHSLPQKFLEKVVELLQQVSPQTAEEIDTDILEYDLELLHVRVQRHLLKYLDACQAVIDKARAKKTQSINEVEVSSAPVENSEVTNSEDQTQAALQPQQ